MVCALSLLWLTCVLTGQETVAPTAADSAKIKLVADYRQYVQDLVDSSRVPGVAICIVIDGQVVLIEGFGVRKFGKPEKIDVNTVFRIASLSKGFASITAGLLVAEDSLSWEDSVLDYLQDLQLKDPDHARTLTVNHLLSQTTGLIPYAYDNLLQANVGLDKIIKKMDEVNITCKAGDCYTYQNVAYSLIDPIIQKATGKSYRTQVRERIFQPLNMNHSSFGRTPMVATGNYAVPHVKVAGIWTPIRIRDNYYTAAPAAGINSSIHDMAHWLKALVGAIPEVIPEKVIREVTSPQISTPRERRRFNYHRRVKSVAYALGWRRLEYGGHPVVFHTGGVRGYLSQIAFLPEKKTGIVVLHNAYSRYGHAFMHKFLGMYLGL